MSDGTQDDVNGTYAYIKTKVGCTAINSGNRATATVQLSQVGGGFSTSVALTDDTVVILGYGQMSIDASYSF